MRHISALRLFATLAACAGLTLSVASAASLEWNPVASHPVEIGPQASRLVVGFKATAGNSIVKELKSRLEQESQTDAQSLAARHHASKTLPKTSN